MWLFFFFFFFQEKQTTLAQYVERMKEKQDAIFYIAGTSREEVCLILLFDFTVRDRLFNAFL